MRLHQKDIIPVSPTDVMKQALLVRKKQENPSQYGNKEHKRAIAALVQSNHPLLFPDTVSPPTPQELAQNIRPNVSYQTALSEYVVGSTRVDSMVGTNLVLEIKPHQKVRYYLQLLVTCMIVSKATNNRLVHGLLYTYSWPKEELLLLENGGQQFWDIALQLCLIAAEIKDKRESSQEIREITRGPSRPKNKKKEDLYGFQTTFPALQAQLIDLRMQGADETNQLEVLRSEFERHWDPLEKELKRSMQKITKWQMYNRAK
jgi:hypothetical protein